MKNYKEIKVENDLKQLLIGSLLGDGCFCSVGSRTKNMCLSIAHSEKQKEYLEYKRDLWCAYKMVRRVLILNKKKWKRFI